MSTDSTPRKIRCPGCGNANYPSDPVCLSCGRELDRSAANSAPPGQRQADSRRDTSGPVNGTVVLVLGCLSLLVGHYWIFGYVLGPVAWVLGNKALAALNEGNGRPSQRGSIQVGRICGMISTGFLALLLLLLAPIVGLGLLLGGGGGGAPTVPKNAPAPAVVLPDLAGQEQTLGAYRGRILLVNFFASW
jgi:hypothetical protein